MNEGMKCGLWFLGGVALGVLGAVAVSKGKLDFKPLATDLLSRGMDVKDALLSRLNPSRKTWKTSPPRPALPQKNAKPPRTAPRPDLSVGFRAGSSPAQNLLVPSGHTGGTTNPLCQQTW